MYTAYFPFINVNQELEKLNDLPKVIPSLDGLVGVQNLNSLLSAPGGFPPHFIDARTFNS